MAKSKQDLVPTWGDLDWNAGPKRLRTQIQKKLSAGVPINLVEPKYTHWDDTVYGVRPFTILDRIREKQLHSGPQFYEWQKLVELLRVRGAVGAFEIPDKSPRNLRRELRQEMLALRHQADLIQKMLNNGFGGNDRNGQAKKLNPALYRVFSKQCSKK